jgi:hypothetical protein
MRAWRRTLAVCAGISAMLISVAPVLVQAGKGAATGNRGVYGELRLSEDNRYVTYRDGAPFFWLGDTAWGIFGRLTREEITHYLTVRKQQGFTVIQMVVIKPSYRQRNVYGVPIGDLASPSDEYFKHVDYAISEAERLGLYTALWPIWSKDQHDLIGPGNAEAYGRFLGTRYRSRPIIWVFGGDDKDERPEVWRLMARGIAIGKSGKEDYSQQLMTYHPSGQRTSLSFHDEPWLDFHMSQTGHDSSQRKPYELIAPVYAKTPVKPVVEAESMYEKHSDGWSDPDKIAGSQLVRNYMYWSVLSGTLGFTYGHWYVWPFVDAGHIHPYSSIAKLRGDWKRDYLNDEVAGQVGFMRKLLESRRWQSGVPDQSLVNNAGGGMSRIQALRGRDGAYMLAYSPAGQPISANLSKLSGKALKAHWYDPRTGRSTEVPNVTRGDSVSFQPPAGGDWVLVVDDASQGFAPPGSGAGRSDGG